MSKRWVNKVTRDRGASSMAIFNVVLTKLTNKKKLRMVFWDFYWKIDTFNTLTRGCNIRNKTVKMTLLVTIGLVIDYIPKMLCAVKNALKSKKHRSEHFIFILCNEMLLTKEQCAVFDTSSLSQSDFLCIFYVQTHNASFDKDNND